MSNKNFHQYLWEIRIFHEEKKNTKYISNKEKYIDMKECILLKEEIYHDEMHVHLVTHHSNASFEDTT